MIRLDFVRTGRLYLTLDSGVQLEAIPGWLMEDGGNAVMMPSATHTLVETPANWMFRPRTGGQVDVVSKSRCPLLIECEQHANRGGWSVMTRMAGVMQPLSIDVPPGRVELNGQPLAIAESTWPWLRRHGWVWPRDDGAVAKCGGPAICNACAAEQAEWERLGRPSPVS